MEGPSLVLAREHLQPFVKRKVIAVAGNTTIAKERMEGLVVKEIFTWGKHLVLQFDGFALKVHFLLFGSYEADVAGSTVTGDYKPTRQPRLSLTFPNGEFRMYACSVKFVEEPRLRNTYDFTVDVLARQWDPAKALRTLKQNEHEQIADVLLDQEIFSGVGNIIKNEVLALAHLLPTAKVAKLSVKKRKEVIRLARSYSQSFLRWRRVFLLKENLKVHRKSTCPTCGGTLRHVATGRRKRMSHYCPHCQKAAG